MMLYSPVPLLRTFATREWPLRISALTGLQCCPGFTLLSDRKIAEDDRSSAAAETGTAVGRLIELWHLGEKFREALDQAEGEKGADFPSADMEAAEFWFHSYVDDDRNQVNSVLAESLEAKVEYELPPAPEDPTGKPIYLVGHLDQVRVLHGRHSVWDVKSGRAQGKQMLFDYAWQQAGYVLASRQRWPELDVQPGGIIRLRGYTKTKAPSDCNVFYQDPRTVKDCEEQLNNVSLHVALIRQGIIVTAPGKHCCWCPAEFYHLCGPMLDRLTL